MVNYAAIDFGSNSTRVLVASLESNKIKKKLKKHIVTRMAEGLPGSKLISKRAIERVNDAVKNLIEDLSVFEVESIFAIGTSAMRESTNFDDVVKIIKDNFDINIEIISGEQEARLSYLGAFYEIEKSSSSILFDIGGGSTEVTYSQGNKIFPYSYKIGVVTITEEVFPSRPVGDAEEKAAIELIRSRITNNIESLYSDTTLAIGTAGTFTSLGAISLGLTSYDARKVHMHEINKSWLDEFYSKLRYLNPDQIIDHYPGIDPARSTTITPGTLIAKELMEIYKINNLLVSENDILEGLILNKVLN